MARLRTPAVAAVARRESRERYQERRARGRAEQLARSRGYAVALADAQRALGRCTPRLVSRVRGAAPSCRAAARSALPEPCVVLGEVDGVVLLLRPRGRWRLGVVTDRVGTLTMLSGSLAGWRSQNVGHVVGQRVGQHERQHGGPFREEESVRSTSPARVRFGAFLADARVHAGYYTQEQLASALNTRADATTVTRHDVSRWERGIRIPDDWLLTIARILGLEPGELRKAAAAARKGLSHPLVAGRPDSWGPPARAASRPEEPPDCVPADEGLDVAWNEDGLLELLEGWSDPMVSRRSFLAVSGLALTGPAWQALDHPPPKWLAREGATARVSPPLLDLVEDIVARAQKIDDEQGSSAAVFVADQFASVGHLLRQGSYRGPDGRRLAAASAHLAQTAGIMA
jgi:hypothetical protein